MADDLSKKLQELEDRIASLAKAPIATDLCREGAGVWVRRSVSQVGVDSGQTKRRTRIVRVQGTGASATAVLESDTPYAGFHNYGTWRTPPNRYWSDGMKAAEEWATSEMGGVVQTEISRVLVSGGVWNPPRT